MDKKSIIIYNKKGKCSFCGEESHIRESTDHFHYLLKTCKSCDELQKTMMDGIIGAVSKVSGVSKDILEGKGISEEQQKQYLKAIGIDWGTEDVTVEAGGFIKDDGSVKITHYSLVPKRRVK